MDILLSDIEFGERSRSEYDGVEDLAASIKERGLIQPIVVNQNMDGTFRLVAGGRRYKALQELRIKTLTQGLTSAPGQAGFVLLSDLPPDELLEIELEENLFRRDLKWQDRALLLEQVHNAKKSLAAIQGDRPWGERQTGELLGCSKGDVNNCRVVAKALRENPKQFNGCTSVSDAIRLLILRKNDEAIKHQLRNSKTTSTTSLTDISDFFDDADTIPDKFLNNTLTSPHPEPVEKTTVWLSRQFIQGDCLEVMEGLKPSMFDHIVCDPPYGINVDFMDLKDLERVEDTHEVEQNVDQLSRFFKLAFKVLKDKGFLVMFYDLDHHEKCLSWAEEAGFKIQRWPLIWKKEHPCRNQAPGYNFTKDFETVMICRKGNATLIKPQATSIVSADGSIERKLYNNPFAKPFHVWKFIYDAIAHKGQSVLDPFVGEGSSSKAAVNLGLIPFGIEVNELHFNKCLTNVKDTYKQLLGEIGVVFK